VLNFVYPPACLLCAEEMSSDEQPFCDECHSKLRPRLKDECPRCGAPVGPFTDLKDGCGQCRRETFAFDRVIRLGVYDDEMRFACLRAKSAGGSNVARALARVLAEDQRKLFDEFSPNVAVPVPEHWTRRLFNSHYAAETISRELARNLGIRWSCKLLTKRRRTPKQATSSTAQRRQQQHGSFGVKAKSDLRGKSILLVDDILTTGSTASAAAKALKQAGAKTVVIAVIAVSPLRK
jgi:ComF family protein